ncbi:Uncharacterised protein [Legionella busanensis]|uniref:RavJ-like C-terminal domain-containing protein n=1 Tax=Legionella busanensis TaxID=190655 RepID=A0A378JK33_9GAMM|nr:DUF5617 domain-containing protein [Legionella busanensis]STX50579.1 Uncharacterised protein [Legionella busanensis]
MFNYKNLIGTQHKLALASIISHLYDPIESEIPSDPVFVHYENNSFIRLFSRQTLLSLQTRLQECPKIIEEGLQDKSFIKLALKEYTPCNKEEIIYKKILTKMVDAGLNFGQIAEECLGIDAAMYLLTGMPENSNITFELSDLPREMIFFIDYIIQLHQLRMNQQDVGESNNIDVEHKSLSIFAERKLVCLQTAIIEENRRKLLSNTGKVLTNNQVLCPFSRDVINVKQSLASARKAKLFLQLIIATAKINALQEPEIDSFLKRQNPNYLREAYQALNQYISNPTIRFTVEQQKLLNNIGVNKIIKPDNYFNLTKRYQHLWNENKSLKENTLTVLSDYSKLNTSLPNFNLFMTCHWARHHHHIVKKAIKRIKENDSIKQVIADLEDQAQVNPKFNPAGSLVRRLEFIKLHFKELNGLTNKILLC